MWHRQRFERVGQVPFNLDEREEITIAQINDPHDVRTSYVYARCMHGKKFNQSETVNGIKRTISKKNVGGAV